jgi:DNA-binding NarL/FixJ family response regulator
VVFPFAEKSRSKCGTATLSGALGNVDITIALFDVAMLHALNPAVIVVDIDSMKTEPLEALRQLRFVLPNCALVVYAGRLTPSQLPALRNAGSNAVLAKGSSDAEVVAGLRCTTAGGFFSDPNFNFERE